MVLITLQKLSKRQITHCGKNVRDALKDANIIDKTDNENVKVTYKIENGGEKYHRRNS